MRKLRVCMSSPALGTREVSSKIRQKRSKSGVILQHMQTQNLHPYWKNSFRLGISRGGGGDVWTRFAEKLRNNVFKPVTGCTNPLEEVLIVDLLGIDRFPRGRAVSSLFQGAGMLLGVPLAGE